MENENNEMKCNEIMSMKMKYGVSKAERENKWRRNENNENGEKLASEGINVNEIMKINGENNEISIIMANMAIAIMKMAMKSRSIN
jgi:hypothetical protein